MENNITDRNNRPRTQALTLELSVGPFGDLHGNDDKALQAGVDYLNRLGGGTLRILPGNYKMQNSLFLQSGVRIVGSGKDTTLYKAPSFSSNLICDADWYEKQIKVSDSSGFSVGCGIVIQSQHAGALQVIKRTVTAIVDNVLHLNNRLDKNAWLSESAKASSLFPLMTAQGVNDVHVSDLVLDGSCGQNETLNGNYVGGLFIQHCNHHLYERIISRNYAGDGFSFQVCDDIRFDNCEAVDNLQLGFHPGSGSQRPILNQCIATGNNQGLFFCWGVTHGKVSSSDFSNNREYGVSFGHRDTDNHLFQCKIESNGIFGILFREEISNFRGAHRNCIEECLFSGNGYQNGGIAIQCYGNPCNVELKANRFENSGKQKIGLKVSNEEHGFILKDNIFVEMEKNITADED
ncbi:MAG: right-handed parallel beta-helix repeat-containing protein [Candidatus Latescibacterota bacterium]|nr:right-handed parallel beta-helix repeat-containing protein [Candidatus Latescibacterota bacterium]